MKKNILLVCYGGGHVKIIEKLYHTLKSDFSVVIIALTSARNYLKSKNIPFVSFSDFPEFITQRERDYGKALSECLDVLDLEETIAYMGVNYTELLDTFGEINGRNKYQNEGRNSFYPIKFMAKVFDLINPSLVITTNSPRAERAALFVAKEKCIPSICVVDNLWIGGGALDVAEQKLATKICVLSEGVKQELIEATTFPEEDIIVTGSPVFDLIKFRRSEWKARKLTRKKVNLLYADGPLPPESPRFPGVIADPDLGKCVRHQLNKLGAAGEVNIIFRPHPNQDLKYSEYENVVVSTQEQDLHDLLIDVDIIVTSVSTVGLEGYLLGAKLVTLENTVYRKVASYERIGLSVGVEKAEDLISTIDNVINSSHDSPNVDLYHGVASENINKLCYKLLNCVAR